MKKALITGITGQDGSYLAELLLLKGYEVHGIKRRSSSFNTQRLDHIYRDSHEDTKLKLHYGDLADSSNLIDLVGQIGPDEIYNLGAQSHVGVSFSNPEMTSNVNALGVLRMLEAIRITGLATKTRFYQASSSELYGLVQESPQNEGTPFYPRSPYGVSKLFGYWITRNYREAYGFYASNGILFNHESPRRGENFVSRKITLSAARIHYGIQRKVALGNLEARRDWGHAKDYVEAMLKIVLHKEADDFVIATGQMYTVSDFAEKVFNKLNLNYRDYVEKDERLFRPNEVDDLLGDARKAHEILGWSSQTTFDELIEDMLESDLKLVRDSI